MIYLVLLAWVAGFLVFWRIPRIGQDAGDNWTHAPVSIIIPARNEEKNIRRLLDSIKGQLFHPSQIIVVDDHSADATGLVAQALGADVMTCPELPAGWLGKPWACWQGALKARHDILIFLDADTFFEPRGLTRLLQAYVKKKGVVCVQPFHQMRKPYEQLAAYFNIIAMAGTNAFTFLGDRLKPLSGSGPCLVCWKADYFRIGGHQSVGCEILENFMLGRKLRENGLDIHCYGGKGILDFQMYPQGLKSMIQGFSKSFAVGSQAMSPISLMAICVWITGAMALTRHLLESCIVFDGTDLIVSVALDLLFAVQAFWMLVRIGNFHWLTGLFFQMPLIFFVVIFFASLFQTNVLKKVQWKGRTLKPGRR